MSKLTFRFSTSELRVIKRFITHDSSFATSVEEFVKLNSQFLNSMVDLIGRLIIKPNLRSVQEEQSLFELDESLSNVYRALCFVERIRLCYSSLMEPFEELSNISPKKRVYKTCLMIAQWYHLCMIGQAEKIAKYQSTSMFNKCMHVEPCEEVNLPFGWVLGSLTPFGSMHRRVSRKIRGSKTLKDRLRRAQAFLYFKKGCPKVSPKFIEEALQKHQKTLGTNPGKLSDCMWCGTASQQSLRGKLRERLEDGGFVPYQAIKRRLRKIVRDVLESYVDPEVWWDPSNSASFLSSQAKGGQASEVNFDVPGWIYQPYASFPEQRYVPRADSDNWDFYDTGKGIIKVPITTVPTFVVTELIRAKPVALSEPLKTRVITCEDSWSTYCLKGAQVELWKCLKNFPWFVLTGRPVEPTDIPIPFGDKDWISVDYSAATDNLHTDFSRICIKYVCRYTGLNFDLCWDSLCNHQIKYGDKFITQQNGQLMGSILSFIVLCLCNAAVLSLSVSPDRYRPDDKILVNGDDGLFLGGEKEYSLWKRISSHVGLSPSVGKVYKSCDFCVINSQCFTRGELGVCEVLYPNAAGMMQFDARTYTEPRSPLDLRESLKLWLQGFPDEEKERAEVLWYQTFDSILKTDWVKQLSISWTMPQALGGLGLPIRCQKDTTLEQPLSRVQQARARCSLVEGKLLRLRPQGPKKRKSCLYEPFRTTRSEVRVSSVSEPSDESRLALKRLGYRGKLEVVGYKGKEVDCFAQFMTKFLSQGNPSITTACLNGKRVIDVLPKKRTCIDLGLCKALLGGKGKYNRYWKDIRDVYASDLSVLDFTSIDTGKVNVWVPRIPKCDLWGRHYNMFLETVQRIREELGSCSP